MRWAGEWGKQIVWGRGKKKIEHDKGEKQIVGGATGETELSGGKAGGEGENKTEWGKAGETNCMGAREKEN